jgi:hypothetical protein
MLHIVGYLTMGPCPCDSSFKDAFIDILEAMVLNILSNLNVLPNPKI